MAVVVFDSDVLIGFLHAGNARHQGARTWLQTALMPGTRWLLCAVNYSEIMIGPLKAGREDHVDEMLVRFGIETVNVDMDLARRAASVQARNRLKLPDAHALATCIRAEHRGWSDVRLASFDSSARNAHANRHLS